MNDSSEVKLHFLDYWRVIRIRWAILVIAFLLVMVTAGVTCFFLPRQFFSKVTIEVKPDNYQLHVWEQGEAFQNYHDPNLQSTQFQVIMSKGILYPVIENLKLVDAWSEKEGGSMLSKEEVYHKLTSGMIELTPIRNTDMFYIGVFSTDRQEAANIANMIAVVYKDVRQNDQIQLREQALAQLKDEIANQKKNIENYQAKLKEIRDRVHIVDPNPEASELTNVSTSIITEEEKQYNDAKSNRMVLQNRIDQITQLRPEELMNGLTSLNITDPTISKILPQYQEAVSEEGGLLSGGFGENHPRVKTLRAKKEVFSQQLYAAVDALRASLAVQLKLAEENMANWEKKQKLTNDEYIKRTNEYQEYTNTKNQYFNAKRLEEQAEQRYSTQSVQVRMSIIPAKIWEKAEPAMRPSKPQVGGIMVAAIIIGLFIGVALAFFIEYLDTSVKTLDDIERYLKIPVLAVIPKGIATLFKHHGDSPDAEAYRILRTNIEFNSRNPNAKTLTLVSGGPGEGKSTTLNNLAVTSARGGYKVLVVDADLRRPSQHTFFDLDNEVGLTNVLFGQKKLEECIQKTAIPNLSFLASGTLPEDAVGILNSQSMIDLITTLKDSYDLIFFDSPPILGVSDASILASEVDMTVMVVQYRRFPRAMLQRVKSSVQNVGGHLLGVVLNNVDTKHDSGYQYYTQYYDYYTPDAERKKRKSIKQIPVGAPLPEKVTTKPEDY